jgi:hypothetical protein
MEDSVSIDLYSGLVDGKNKTQSDRREAEA